MYCTSPKLLPVGSICISFHTFPSLTSHHSHLFLSHTLYLLPTWTLVLIPIDNIHNHNLPINDEDIEKAITILILFLSVIISVCWVAGAGVGLLPLFGWHAAEDSNRGCYFVEVMDYNYLLLIYFATIVTPSVLLAAFYAHIYRVVVKQVCLFLY